MPMKQGLLPKWNVVIRDLKRGAPEVVYKEKGEEIRRNVTLANSIIPDKFMAETNPNNPTEPDTIKAWDTERLQWITFKISELEVYKPFPGYGWEEDTVSGDEKTEETRIDKKGSRDRGTQGIQASQETQTNDGGAEGKGKAEPSKGEGSKGTSKEQ